MVDSRRLDLLDPAEVARLGGIEIVAQGVVEGILAGIHRSPFRGFSVEVTEHRAYQPRGELRYLDWKILARAGPPFVQQFEEETTLRRRGAGFPASSPAAGSSYSFPISSWTARSP